MAKKNHNKDIDLIDSLVHQYKTGTVAERNEALEKLIGHFDEYIKKYVNLLHGGEANLQNPDTFKFLSLFLAGKDKTTENLRFARRGIARVMSYYDSGDIYNELVLIFIKLLDRYKVYENEQGRVNFVYYFTKYFRYRAKDWFNSLCTQPLFKSPVSIDAGYEDEDGQTLPFLDKQLMDSGFDTSMEDIETSFDLRRMNLSWVLNSKEPLFRELTSYERLLLYNCYVMDMSVQAIAESWGRDKDTIWRHLQKVLDKLRVRLGIHGEEQNKRKGQESNFSGAGLSGRQGSDPGSSWGAGRSEGKVA